MLLSDAFRLFEVQELQLRGAKSKTIANYRWAFSSLLESVGDFDVRLLGIDHMVMWKTTLRDNGIQATSLNSLVSKVRMLLKWLEEQEVPVLDYRKIYRDKEIYKPKTFLDPDEVKRLIKATNNPRDYALIWLYFATGCRLSEILNLDRQDFERSTLVDEENGIYEIMVLGKGDKYRPVYFATPVHEAVEAYLDTRHDYFKPLFMSNQNRRLGGSRVEKLVHEITRKAGLDKHVTPHTLRHSFTSDLITRGAPISATSTLLGHANQTTTLNIYSHINTKQTIQAYADNHTRVK
jgi:site-specific recombinase XerD